MAIIKTGLKLLGGLCLGVLTACNTGGSKMDAKDFFKTDMVTLIQTIQKGDEANARQLLDNGLSLNVYGENGITPLFYLLMKKDKPAIQLALKLGADPNMKEPDRGSPLSMTSGGNDDEIIQILLEGGADPNTLDHNGDPVLFDAIGEERMAQIEMLIKHGADVDLKNRSGENSVLHCAYINKFEIAYRLITEYGADYTVRDEGGGDIAYNIHKKLSKNLLGKEFPAYGWAVKLKEYLIAHGVQWPPLSPQEIRKAQGRE